MHETIVEVGAKRGQRKMELDRTMERDHQDTEEMLFDKHQNLNEEDVSKQKC
jgi:hypothetical protein